MRSSPDMTDYDLVKWRPGLNEYMAVLSGKKSAYFKDTRRNKILLSKWSSRELYALITVVLQLKPNGVMTRLIEGKPMNNLWWWDFVITDGDTLLSIMCSNSGVEIASYSHKDGFDIDDFLEFNMNRYKKYIDIKIDTFEVHESYVNHYQSYRRVTEHLLYKIKKLDISKPAKSQIALGEGESKKIIKELKRYSRNSIEFHALGKSLVLNSAFMAEAYVSLICRIGSGLYGSEEKRKFKAFHSKNFESRVKNLYQICDAFFVEIDTSVPEIQNMLRIMTLRNKYVHADLSSKLNELEPAYFDGDYPLLDSRNGNFIVDTIESAFHNPDLQTVLESYKTSTEFIEYIHSLIPSRKRPRFDAILDLRVLTRNRDTHRYSLIHQQGAQLGIAITGE